MVGRKELGRMMKNWIDSSFILFIHKCPSPPLCSYNSIRHLSPANTHVTHASLHGLRPLRPRHGHLESWGLAESPKLINYFQLCRYGAIN